MHESGPPFNQKTVLPAKLTFIHSLRHRQRIRDLLF